MPELPGGPELDGGLALPSSSTPARVPAGSPYEQIAADLRAAIRCGALGGGDPIPTVKDLASRYTVSVVTAHRAVALLTRSREVVASRGRRAFVVDRSPER
jgi:DNA-binding GntR family transcriptional regulator